MYDNTILITTVAVLLLPVLYAVLHLLARREEPTILKQQ